MAAEYVSTLLLHSFGIWYLLLLWKKVNIFFNQSTPGTEDLIQSLTVPSTIRHKILIVVASEKKLQEKKLFYADASGIIFFLDCSACFRSIYF